MKKILLIALCLLAVACAKRPLPEQTVVTDEALAQRWQAMQAMPGVPGPYRDQLSLRFGTEGDTRRVTALLWGNNDSELRLDVMAGVGALIAKIREAGPSFLVFAPRENKAYFHEGDTKPLLKIGVPVPFGVSSLADIINGRYAAVFGSKYTSAAMNSKGQAEYGIEGKQPGTLTLDQQGQPVAWRQKHGGWTLTLTYDDTNPALPHSLRLANDNGQKAIVLVKERENPATPFSAEQMSLAVPGGAQRLPLSQFRDSRSSGE